MNDLLQETLARGARAVSAPELDVAGTIARGERRLRRRRGGAVVGAVLAVALVIGGPSLWADLREEPRTAHQPGPVDPTQPPDDKPVPTHSRPLVWAEGSQLHVGERQIDIGFTPPFWKGDFHTVTKDSLGGLWATDDGAVFATYDGRIWFSDGTSTAQIGSMPLGERERWTFITHPPSTWVQTDPSGSRAVWMDVVDDSPEVVVYDTGTRQISDRVPLPVPAGRGIGHWQVLGDHVYWNHFPRNGSSLRDRLMRTTLTTGVTEPATEAMMLTGRAGLRPALLVGQKRVTERDAQTFVVKDSRLRGLHPDGDPEDRRLLPIRDADTGEALSFRAPEDLQGGGELVLFSWLDGDRFALSATPGNEVERRDIVVCRVSTQDCQVVVANGKGPRLVLPWSGMPG